MSSKTLHVVFGRMNPPTTAHQLLLNTILEESEGHCRVYLSETQNLENPLSVAERQLTLSKSIPELGDPLCGDSIFDYKVDSARDLFTAMDKADMFMEEHKYTEIMLWCGSDRIPAVERVLLYPQRWKFKVAGINTLNRTDSDVSATAVRAAVVNKDTTTYNRMAMASPFRQDWLFDILHERLTNGSLESKAKTGKGRKQRC